MSKNPCIGSSHGNTATINSEIPIVVMPEATYQFSPPGRWHIPTSTLTTIRMPKCIGLIPRQTTTGNSMGAMISTTVVFTSLGALVFPAYGDTIRLGFVPMFVSEIMVGL